MNLTEKIEGIIRETFKEWYKSRYAKDFNMGVLQDNHYKDLAKSLSQWILSCLPEEKNEPVSREEDWCDILDQLCTNKRIAHNNCLKLIKEKLNGK